MSNPSSGDGGITTDAADEGLDVALSGPAPTAQQRVRHSERPPRPAPSGRKRLAIVVFSGLLFVGSFLLLLPAELALVIAGAVMAHEAGHLVAMLAFGFRDPTVFFVPFLGGAVLARKDDTTPTQQVVVLLAGPLPGLLVGLLMLWSAGPDGSRLVRVAGSALLLLNVPNLIPLPPLDGGKIVDLLLLGGRPRLATGYKLVASVLVLAAAASGLGGTGRIGWLGAAGLVLVGMGAFASAVVDWRRLPMERALRALPTSGVDQLEQLDQLDRLEQLEQRTTMAYAALDAAGLQRRSRAARAGAVRAWLDGRMNGGGFRPAVRGGLLAVYLASAVGGSFATVALLDQQRHERREWPRPGYATRASDLDPLARRQLMAELASASARLASDPSDGEAWRRRAYAVLGLGSTRSAAHDLDHALALRPGDGEACVVRARVRASLRGDDRLDSPYLRQQFEACAATASGHPMVWVAQADLSLRNRRWSDAVREATRLVELRPRWGVGYDLRADAYEGMGDRARAAADRAKAEVLFGTTVPTTRAGRR